MDTHNEPNNPGQGPREHSAPEVPWDEKAAREEAARRRARERSDLERFLIVKGAYAAGIVLLIAGSAFFIQYALDNMWIGMQGRIILGLLAGTIAIMAGSPLAARGHRWASEGLTALGASVSYVSLWASWQPTFHVLPQPVACILMTVVTATIALFSYRRSSETLAFAALIGGMITPTLLAYNSNAHAQLTAYLTILDAMFVILATVRSWSRVSVGAFLATAVYSIGIAQSSPASAVEASFLYAPFVFAAALRRTRLSDIILTSSTFCYGLHIESDLAGKTVALTSTLVGAGAIFLGASFLTRNRTFAWCAAGLATIAIPVQLHAGNMYAAWAIEAALLGIAGLRMPDMIFRFAGTGLFAYVILRLISIYPAFSADALILNDRCITLSITAIALAAFTTHLKKYIQVLHEEEHPVAVCLRVAVTSLTLWMVSAEAYDATLSGFSSEQAALVSLSVVWSIFACCLFTFGFLRRVELLRWEGISLGAICVFKVLFFDLATLPSGERIVSSLAVGSVITLLSFVYQLRTARNGKDETA